jgi:hypothetical protein
MNASMNEWQVGYVLSEEEASTLEASGDLNEIIAVTTHPTPGGYFSDPYAGTYLLHHKSGHCFASLPNVDDPDSEPNEIVHLGKVESDEGLLSIATAFIIADDHEAAAAIKFHFDEKDFQPDDWYWLALPEFYWFRLGGDLTRLAERLDGELKILSPLYKHLSTFFDEPNADIYSAFRQEVERYNFEVAFTLHKYNLAQE